MKRERARGAEAHRAWCVAALTLAALFLGGSRAAHAKFESVRERIRAAIEAEELPAFAVAVARHGETLWEEAFGLADVDRGMPATIDTMFSLASVTKPLTATALMVAVERGDIDLDAPINDYLGAAPLRAGTGRTEEATVRRVASHTAGLPLHHHFFPATGPTPPPLAETIRRYGTLSAEPGKRFEYSNLGYAVLELALETVSEEDFADFMQNEVFLPLGMKHTAVVVDPDAETRAMALRYDAEGKPIPFYDFDHRGASAVYASARDLLRFGMFHIDTLLPEQKPVVSERARSEMQKPRAKMPGGTHYGIGWIVYDDHHGERIVEHGGGMPGVSTLVQLIPRRRIVVVTLASSRSDLPRRVANDVVSELVPPSLRFRNSSFSSRGNGPRRRTSGDTNPPGRFRGTWEGNVYAYDGDISLRLTVDEDLGLRLEVDSRSPVPLRGVAFDGDRLTALAQERLGTSDARGPSMLRLSLTRRGDDLQGTVTVLASGNEALPLALSHWAELSKSDSGE